jgi:hypothetical protein
MFRNSPHIARDLVSALLIGLCITPVIFAGIEAVTAQVMESSNYSIESDSVNFGGGLSTSSSYTLESTAGEIATGESDSATYSLHAGYQQMHVVYMAMTAPADVTLSPSIGAGGGTSNGSTTVTVTTDGAAGYTLTIEASSNPAMQSGSDTIDDYAPAGADPDFTFTTGASDAHFGYSPEGSHVADRFLDNGSTCNTGSTDTASSCWDGLSTTEETIAESASPNHPSGTATNIRFRVGIGASVSQPAGTYVATTTLTALPL